MNDVTPWFTTTIDYRAREIDTASLTGQLTILYIL